MSKKKPAATFEELKSFVKSLHLRNDAEFKAYVSANNRGEVFFNRRGMRCPDCPFNISYYLLKRTFPEYKNFNDLMDIPEKVRPYPSIYKSARQVRRFIIDHLTLTCLEDWDTYCELSRISDTNTVELNGTTVPKKPVWVPEDITGTYGPPSIQYSIQWFFNIQPPELIEHPKYAPYEQARAFVHKLGLASVCHWTKYVKLTNIGKQYKFVDGTILPPRPSWVPGLPESVYITYGGWVSWKDFLGDAEYQKIMPFEEAREFVRSLHLSSYKEYRAYYLHSKKIGVFRNQFDEVCDFPPYNLPPLPHEVYKKLGVWTDYADFLGKANNKIQYMDYESAKEFVVPLELSNTHEWQKYIEITTKYGTYVNASGMELPPPPVNLHKYPMFFYKCRKEWKGWTDFLRGDSVLSQNRNGHTRSLIKRSYWPYAHAREFVQELRLTSVKEYIAYINCEPHLPYYNTFQMRCEPRPELLPKNTSNHYMSEFSWVSWADFLGLSVRQDVPYEDCKYVAARFNIKKKAHWAKIVKENSLSVPIDVEGYYRVRGSWISWNDLFNIVEYDILPYDEAKTYITSLHLSSAASYAKWWSANQPTFLPPTLNYYKKYSEYNVSDLLGMTLSAKFENMQNDISVFYISRYPDDPTNIISISVDSYGKANAIQLVKKKHQTIVAMFDLFSRVDELRRITNTYCEQYSAGESNQYVTHNLNQLLFALRQEFHETQIYKSVTIDRVNADSLQYI
jgi:hypothetical protein